jgi:hypothetical protein
MTDFNVQGIGIDSSSSYGPVGTSFATVLDLSTVDNSTVSLVSMTIANSSVNGGLHLFTSANTTTIGIVVNNATPLVGNLATSYWIYSLDTLVSTGIIRMIRAVFQLSGNNLQVKHDSRRFINATSVSATNQNAAYLSTAGSSSSGTILSNVTINYNPPTLFADKSTSRVGVGTAMPSEYLEVIGTIKATDINFTNLPIYADESAATTGGLDSGDLYRTATGEIRIKL